MSGFDRTKVPGPGPVREMVFPGIGRGALDNGLELLSARHGDLPVVTAELVIGTGAAGDPAGREGLAYLTLHALETGTRERDADRLARELESLGVELDAITTWDATLVRVTAPRDRLEPAFALLAEIVRDPIFAESEVERLRDEQLATIAQRRKDPGALANERAIHYIFAEDTPYSRPLIGTPSSVEMIERSDLEAFHRAHYLPGHASLLFVGDIDLDEAEELAETYLGGWGRGEPATPEFEVRPRVETSTIFVVDRPGAVQSEIRIGDIGVARDDEDYFPILVMNTILGGAFTSRLNMNLRERHGFTYGARSDFAFRKEPGPFIVQTAVATEVTARAVEEAYREIVELRENGPTEVEVGTTRDYLRGIMPLELQTTGQLASRLADIVIYGLPDDYFEEYRDQIAAVTRDDVLRVARERLRPDHLAITVVGDAAEITEPLRKLGIGEVEVGDADP